MKKIFFTLLVSLLVYGCESDPLKEGIESSVQGKVFDSFNNIPFENVKLKIAEYKIQPAGIYTTYEFIKWIDSTYTDANGEYNLKFKTSGKGDFYSIHVGEKIDLWTFYYDPIKIDKIGGNNIRNLDFLHLYPTNLKITLNNLDYTPIDIDVNLFSDLPKIETGTGEIERLLYSNKREETKITFRRKNSKNEQESYSITIPRLNTSNLTDYNITLNNADFK